jgi:hypothetical protein
MFALIYLSQEYEDVFDFKLIAVSRDKDKLQAKKEELCAKFVVYAQEYKDYVENARKGIREFANRQHKALRKYRTGPSKRFSMKEMRIRALEINYPHFVGNKNHRKYLEQHLNFDLLTEELPIFTPPTSVCEYNTNCLEIREVDEI